MKGHFLGCRSYPKCSPAMCRCEIIGCLLLFLIATTTSLVQYWVATQLAHSSAVLADATDAFMHSLWYSAPLWVLGIVWILRLVNKYSESREVKLFSRLVLWNMISLGLALLFVVYQAVGKLIASEQVASGYMLLGGLVGLAGNSLSLIILRVLLKQVKKDTTALVQAKDKIYKSFHFHAEGDFSISLVVTLAALVALASTLAPFLRSHLDIVYRAEAILGIVIVVWIGKKGYKLFWSH